MALDHPPQLKAVKKGVVVQPVEMAKKLMDIREQLAVEWREDLTNIQVRPVGDLTNLCIRSDRIDCSILAPGASDVLVRADGYPRLISCVAW